MTYCFIKCRSDLLIRQRLLWCSGAPCASTLPWYGLHTFIWLLWAFRLCFASRSTASIITPRAFPFSKSRSSTREWGTYVAIIQLQLAFSTKARLGASATAFFSACGYFARLTYARVVVHLLNSLRRPSIVSSKTMSFALHSGYRFLHTPKPSLCSLSPSD